ncbi:MULTISPECIES: hypothetical protein [unclassified Streptomyces]|uniref:hypothetical protein n=1 Tax=unclassified Streptomyces TaxID=2593676 RepID=UPI00362EB764
MQTKKIQMATVCAISVLALFLTGCSGGSDSKDSSGGGAGQSTSDDKRAKANDCLRKKGARVTDPKDGQGGQIDPGSMSEDEFAQAMKDCEVGGGQADAGMEQEMKDKMLAYAECMRKEGLDFPDPEFEGGRAKVGQIPEGDKAAFAAADKVCAAKTG